MMNKDNVEGGIRSAVGQGEKIVGRAMSDTGTTAQGYLDDATGRVQSAIGSAKDALSGGVDAAAGMRDQAGKMAQSVSEYAQKQASAATDSLSQSQTMADVEARIKQNPWGAVLVAALIGLVVGKVL
jgi:uncharacterized protein YjbJ (UPF0337 family)